MSAVTIVIPVYNEGENIRRTLAEIDAKLAVEAEVWLVYDNDSDFWTAPAILDLNYGKVYFRDNIKPDIDCIPALHKISWQP